MTFITINRNKLASLQPIFNIHPVILSLLILGVLYQSLPFWIYHTDPTAALPDAGIWSLLFIALISFLILLLLSGYLFKASLQELGLPHLSSLVLKFQTLTLWQQYIFYWASFALVLLTAVGCVAAIF